jgi:hypothetical protein
MASSLTNPAFSMINITISDSVKKKSHAVTSDRKPIKKNLCGISAVLANRGNIIKVVC